MIHSATVNFGPWYALAEAAATALDAPGLLQARAAAVLPYPRGRSAMVLYGASRACETLRSYVSGRGAGPLRRAGAAGARWVRFGAAADPERALADQLARFTDRFGAPPVANTAGDATPTPEPAQKDPHV